VPTSSCISHSLNSPGLSSQGRDYSIRNNLSTLLIRAFLFFTQILFLALKGEMNIHLHKLDVIWCISITSDVLGWQTKKEAFFGYYVIALEPPK